MGGGKYVQVSTRVTWPAMCQRSSTMDPTTSVEEYTGCVVILQYCFPIPTKFMNIIVV